VVWSQGLWTRLRCSRCTFASEHRGPVRPGDLDRCCAFCGAGLGTVTVDGVNTVRVPVAVGSVRRFRFFVHG
jgi:hypothetical protein